MSQSSHLRSGLLRGAALGALIALLGCSGSDAPPPATATVKRARIERVVVATGTIEPVKEVEVRPRIAGIVEHIRVKEGELVKRGQVLVEIEKSLLAAQVREARAALEQARVEARYAGIDLERARRLRQGGAASEEKLDGARARQEQARAGVAGAQARLDTLKTQLDYATVVSPLAGRVLEIPTEEGNAVSPVTAVTGGTLLLSLAATDGLNLKGLVDENEVARLELGMPARVRTEAFGDRVFKGRVKEIAPVGQRVQNVTYFEVKVQITDPDAGLLRPRMSGDADIVAEVVPDAVVVPETALRYRGEQVYVEVPDGSSPPADHDVTIGIVDGDRVQVLSGVEPGEQVVLQ